MTGSADGEVARITEIPPRRAGSLYRRWAAPEPPSVLYLGSSANLGALRRLMEARGAVTRSRLTAAVTVVVADPSVPTDHPTLRAAASLNIPIMAPTDVVEALMPSRPRPERGAGVAGDVETDQQVIQGDRSRTGGHLVADAAATEDEESRTGSHLLDDLLDTAEQALREKLHPTVAAVETGGSQDTVDAQLDELLRRADARLRATLSDQGTAVGRLVPRRESSVRVSRPDPQRQDFPDLGAQRTRQPRPRLDDTVLHRGLAADLSSAMIYALLRLRFEVFVVEQACPYQELDGHDLDRTTRHYWLAPPDAVEDPQATLRLLEPTEGQFRIGRVCAAPQARRQGEWRRLLEAALSEVGDAPCVVDAQLDRVELFVAFGFVVTGPESTKGGIPHVPMGRSVTVRTRNGV